MTEPAFKQPPSKRKSTSSPAQTSNTIGEAPTASSCLRTSYEDTMQKIENMFNDCEFASVEEDRAEEMYKDMKAHAENAYESGKSYVYTHTPTCPHIRLHLPASPARPPARLPAWPPACPLARLRARPPVCLPAFPHAFLPARPLACTPSRTPAHLPAYQRTRSSACTPAR